MEEIKKQIEALRTQLIAETKKYLELLETTQDEMVRGCISCRFNKEKAGINKKINELERKAKKAKIAHNLQKQALEKQAKQVRIKKADSLLSKCETYGQAKTIMQYFVSEMRKKFGVNIFFDLFINGTENETK